MLYYLEYYGDKYSIQISPHTTQYRKDALVPRDHLCYPDLYRQILLKGLEYGLTSFRGKFTVITCSMGTKYAMSLLVTLTEDNIIHVNTVLNHPKHFHSMFITCRNRINIYHLVLPQLTAYQAYQKRVAAQQKPKRKPKNFRKSNYKPPVPERNLASTTFNKYYLDSYQTTHDFKRNLNQETLCTVFPHQ